MATSLTIKFHFSSGNEENQKQKKYDQTENTKVNVKNHQKGIQSNREHQVVMIMIMTMII